MSRTAFATVDPQMLKIAAVIDRYGMNVVHVGEGCDCPVCHEAPVAPAEWFGYTIGLTELGIPNWWCAASAAVRPRLYWADGATWFWAGNRSTPATSCVRDRLERPGNWYPSTGHGGYCAGPTSTTAPARRRSVRSNSSRPAARAPAGPAADTRDFLPPPAS